MDVSNKWELSTIVRTSLFAVATVGILYTIHYMFRKKKFSPETARVVGRLYFYPTLPAIIFGFGLGFRGNWWDVIDETILLGAAPLPFFGHANKLYKMGVRGVINLCDEYSGPISEYEKKGITQLILPTIDHYEPTLDFIERAMDFIQRHRERGQSVLIHCRGGHGRSAAIAICWIVYSTKMNLKEAQNYLLSKRHVRTHLYKQPNVVAFCTKLGKA